MPRPIRRVVAAQPTSDGAGVRLFRALGTDALPMIDPFLMLDEFRSDRADDYVAGFPPHPHRGFETVTIVLAGAMRHKDNVGNTGHLRAGSVQWMTAGRGIVHEEMPEQVDGLMWGFQLWVNLPRAHKRMAPRYQDIPADRIPTVDYGGARLRVIAGVVDGVRGPVEGIVTDPLLIDATVPPGGEATLPFPTAKDGFLYVFEGEATVEGTRVPTRHLAAVGQGEDVVVRAGAEGARVLLVAGDPVREPVARYGPFVMSTESELVEAFKDYQAGRIGG